MLRMQSLQSSCYSCYFWKLEQAAPVKNMHVSNYLKRVEFCNIVDIAKDKLSVSQAYCGQYESIVESVTVHNSYRTPIAY